MSVTVISTTPESDDLQHNDPTITPNDPTDTQQLVYFMPITDRVTNSLPSFDPKDTVPNFHGFEPVLRRSSRIRTPKVIQYFLAKPDTHPFPDPDNLFNYNDAISGRNANQWVAAMQTEMDALHHLETWTLVPRPSDRTIVKCRWVYAVKRTITGLVERYRARLVAKGFSQKAGVDFDETFSPVVKYDSLRIILSIAAAENLDLFQFNVSSAFRYGELNEEIYLEQPEGFCVTEREGAFTDYTNVYMA